MTRQPHDVRNKRLFTPFPLFAFILTTVLGAALTVSKPAQASDCTLGFCGYVVNKSDWTLVAASRDKRGGWCPPYGSCGTCDVPPYGNSANDCDNIFRDADVFTFDNHDFYVEGVHYSAHHYVSFHSYQFIYCTGSSRIDCGVYIQ